MNVVLDSEKLRLDSSDMLGKVAGMPAQLRAGFDLGREAWKPMANLRPSAIVVAGVGGSAIGGDILRTYLLGLSAIPLTVCREYSLPRFVAGDSLVVICSYSGNTEEALSCFRDAMKRNADIVCVTSGGELLAEAGKHAMPCVELPAGYPPRAALGYSFSALLALASSLRLCGPQEADIGECIDVLEKLSDSYAAAGSGGNQAVSIAENLVDKVPVIYCSNQLAAVGLRWKNQLCENSKKLAFVGLVPEMSHNDIMGWEVDDESMRGGVVLLRMPGDHPRLALRFSFVKELIAGKTGFCEEFWSTGSSLLAQIFSLILLGDYVSVYLALMRGIDPTPIGTIDELKSWIGRR